MPDRETETAAQRRERYLRLAAEAETEAADLRDPAEQAQMLQIAEAWKRLATAAKTRLA
jgi:hypothetical protein